MTLEEAIIHSKEKACGNTQCAFEHRQLAEWLKELQELRKYSSNTETIEERAKEVGKLSQYRSDYPYDKKSVEFGYMAGATERKIIQERAKEYASKKADISPSPVYNEALARIYEEGYAAGAEEQRKIDIDKACEWLNRYLHLFVMKGHINHSALEQEFRRMMEE